MKRFIALLATSVAGLLAVGISPAVATPSVATPSTCVPGSSQVFHTLVSNRPDSGQAGNNWAYDTFNRTTTVSTNCEGTFTVTIKDFGSFKTIPGQTSPGKTATLPPLQCVGVFSGGAHAIVESKQIHAHTPGGFSNGSKSTTEWLALLFPGTGAQLDQWGWHYKLGGEVWVNAQSGNSGDVTGRYCAKPRDHFDLSIKISCCEHGKQSAAWVKVTTNHKPHKPVDVPYSTTDGQHGTLHLAGNKLSATERITFDEDAGDGVVKVTLGEGKYAKRAEVKTDCKPEETTTTTVPPTSTTTTTTTSSETVLPTSTTSQVIAGAIPVANDRDLSSDKDLAYTGTSSALPFVLIGGVLLLGAGGIALLFARRRRDVGQSGEHRS